MTEQIKIHLDRIPDEKLDGVAMPMILAGVREKLIGRTIREVTYVEICDEAYPAVILDNGVVILASCDDEGNGPGVIGVECRNEGWCLCQTTINQ